MERSELERNTDRMRLFLMCFQRQSRAIWKLGKAFNQKKLAQKAIWESWSYEKFHTVLSKKLNKKIKKFGMNLVSLEPISE